MDICHYPASPSVFHRVVNFGMGVVLSMRLITFAIAVLLPGGAIGTYMSSGHHAHWPGLTAYAGGKEAMRAAEVKNLRYVTIRPLYIPVIGENGLSQNVSFSVVIEVPDSQEASLAEAVKPLLTNAFIHDIYGVLDNSSGLRGGAVRVDVIKDRLNRTSRRILGDENVNEVLLEVVDQRPM
jgi:flagellar FliL protein